MNIRRRHLTAAERARYAIEAFEAGVKANTETEKHLTVSKGGRGNTSLASQVAKLAGVSKPTALEQVAIKADPELDARVEAKELTPQEAGRIVRERKKRSSRAMTPEEKEARRLERQLERQARARQRAEEREAARQRERQGVVDTGVRYTVELALNRQWQIDRYLGPGQTLADAIAEYLQEAVEREEIHAVVISVHQTEPSNATTIAASSTI
jgi:hypothetical protein